MLAGGRGGPVRKALNDNPMAQVGILGVLALLVGFFLITQTGKKGSSSSTDTSTSAASVAPGTATTPTDSSAIATAPTDSTVAPSSTAPSTSPDAATGTAVSPAPASAAAAQAAAAGEFVVGPGLPAPVVKAYADNKVVVLLVVRRGGIDDDAVKASVERMAGGSDIALFMTNAGHVSRYSRIATGVNLDRVPALIVLRPRKLTSGTPIATVSYGFRGPDSVAQAIHDALYKGPTNEPYYPK
jgi:hypothetical protein